MFGRDLERASVSVRQTPNKMSWDDESFVSGRSGASERFWRWSFRSTRGGAGRSHTHSPTGHTDPSKRIGESLDEVNLSEVCENSKAGIGHVCVKASPAFGRRHLHTNTDVFVDRLGLNQGWPKQGLA